jgi:hypothetical protein
MRVIYTDQIALFVSGFGLAAAIAVALVAVEALARSDAERAYKAEQKSAREVLMKKWEKCHDTSEAFALQATHGGDEYCVWHGKGPLGLIRLEKL